jgi:triosephosphate isomerase
MENCRKPLALANWKMAMTIEESLDFARAFSAAAGDFLDTVDVVLCPPYTALYSLYQALEKKPIALGGQDVCAEAGSSHTGQISASLLADAGCTWAMVGHWEVRRRTGEEDRTLNRKVHAALRAGLRPVLLMGEAASEKFRLEEALASRLSDLVAGCEPEDMVSAAVIYEPEWTIGGMEPARPDDIAQGCGFIRQWIGKTFGEQAARSMRIIYGGSVAPENAEALLGSPEVDGLGAGRKGRDPVAFAQIVRLIARVKRAGCFK